MSIDEIESALALGGSGCRRDVADDRQPVAILHQHVAHEAQPALLAIALAEELGIRVGRTRMRLVRALLAAEVALAVAAAGRRLARAVLRPEALPSGPRLQPPPA